MLKIEELNTFANQCGYFYNACIEKNISVNNGYNCKHTEQKKKKLLMMRK